MRYVGKSRNQVIWLKAKGILRQESEPFTLIALRLPFYILEQWLRGLQSSRDYVAAGGKPLVCSTSLHFRIIPHLKILYEVYTIFSMILIEWPVSVEVILSSFLELSTPAGFCSSAVKIGQKVQKLNGGVSRVYFGRSLNTTSIYIEKNARQ